MKAFQSSAAVRRWSGDLKARLLLIVASLLFAHVALCDVIIYKFSSLEQFIGGGVEKRGVVRGFIIIDPLTSGLSIVGTSVINKRKELVVESLPAVDIRTLVGAAGRTHTMISILEQYHPGSETNTFTRTYARGVNSLVEWAPGRFAMWPRRMSFSGSSLASNGTNLLANEGAGSLTLLIKDTVTVNQLGLNRAQLTDLLVTQFQQLGYMLIASVAAGRVIVSHDDLVFDETAFHEPADPAAFAQNIAAWFSGGRAGRFLAYTDHQGFTGDSLISAMTSAGHTWVVSTSTSVTVSDLLSFDGIFLCGHPIAEDILSNYVNAGGNVYLAGVGVTNVDMDMWNPFLQRLGLAFTNIGTGVADFSVTGNHPILTGIDHLYGVNGTSVIALQPSNLLSGVLVSNSGSGLFALWGQTNRHSGWRAWFTAP